MSKFLVGARLHDDNGPKFARFCAQHKVTVALDENSSLLFGENDHDEVMEMWNLFCAEDLAKVCLSLGVAQ